MIIAPYDSDIIAWAQQQTGFLRSGQFTLLNIEHIAEEIEDAGKSKQRELENRLEVLLMHLIKWQYQPNIQGQSWRLMIMEQRRRVAGIEKNPRLSARIPEIFQEIYDDARFSAMKETDLDIEMFSELCP
ncbi:DUF29 domain-containing protein [Gammaproteobacteria bacterium]